MTRTAIATLSPEQINNALNAYQHPLASPMRNHYFDHHAHL